MSSGRTSRKYRNYSDTNINHVDKRRSTRKNNYIEDHANDNISHEENGIELTTFKKNILSIDNPSSVNFILNHSSRFIELFTNAVNKTYSNQEEKIRQLSTNHQVDKKNIDILTVLNREKLKVQNLYLDINKLITDFKTKYSIYMNTVDKKKAKELKKELNYIISNIDWYLCRWMGIENGEILETIINKSNDELKEMIRHYKHLFCYTPTVGGKSRRRRNKKRNMRKKRKTIKTRN